MTDSPFKESKKDKSVVFRIAASQAVSLLVMLVLCASFCDKGHFGNKVRRDCRIAVSNRSYNRLKTRFIVTYPHTDTFSNV